MSPGSVYSGVAGPEYIRFRGFGNTRPAARRVRRRDSFRVSAVAVTAVAAHVLDEHLCAETIRLFHVLVVVALTVADLPKLLVPELPARLASLDVSSD